MKKLIAHDEDNLANTSELDLEGVVDEGQWALIVSTLARDTDAVLDMLRSVEDNAETEKAGEVRNFIDYIELMAKPVIEWEEP